MLKNVQFYLDFTARAVKAGREIFVFGKKSSTVENKCTSVCRKVQNSMFKGLKNFLV